MNIFFCIALAVLAVSAQSLVAFKLEGLQHDKYDVPIVTESESGVRVQLGVREPKVVVVPNSVQADDCGETLSYPGNGADYLNNEDVVFLINSETREPRELLFPVLDVENYFDSVTVFVFNNNQFELVGQYSGSPPLSPVTVPEGRFLISFKSDSIYVGKGFTFVLRNSSDLAQVGKKAAAIAQKISIEDIPSPIVTETATGILVKLGNREPVVVANLDEDCGEFSYPPNDGVYENNEDVVFLINTKPRGPKEFALPKFNTENYYDVASIFVFENNQFNLIARYSGSYLPSAFIAPEGRVLISFTSNNLYTYSGFKVVWYNPPSSLQN